MCRICQYNAILDWPWLEAACIFRLVMRPIDAYSDSILTELMLS